MPQHVLSQAVLHGDLLSLDVVIISLVNQGIYIYMYVCMCMCLSVPHRPQQHISGAVCFSLLCFPNPQRDKCLCLGFFHAYTYTITLVNRMQASPNM